MIKLTDVLKFEWDEGNIYKNLIKHNVTDFEAESVFFNRPILLVNDKKHSTTSEKRYIALGKTNKGRKLFISFTKKNDKVRIISVRDMAVLERKHYEEHERKRQNI